MWKLDRKRLADLRSVGDLEADVFVADQVAGMSTGERSLWLSHAIQDLRHLPPVETSWAEDWCSQSVDFAAWVDPELLDRGRRVFDRYSLDLTTALFCASLPFCFASGRGAAVLAGVSELYDSTTVSGRVNLTGRMLLDITSPGGLVAGGSGVRTLRRVRLLHACVRARLLTRPPAWQIQLLGVPINQEDLLATQISFTTIAFAGVERLGNPMTTDEKVAYLHLWAVAASLLGITHAASLRDLEVADDLTAIFFDTLEEPSPHGVHLMSTLLESIATTMPYGLRGLPAGLVRHVAGRDLAEMLEVPRSPWSAVISAAARIDAQIARTPFGREVLRLPSRVMGRTSIRRSIARGGAAIESEAYWPDRFAAPR